MVDIRESLLRRVESSSGPAVSPKSSFEVMPPRADAEREAFEAFLGGLAVLDPPFISVTCHRGRFAATLEVAASIQARWGIVAMPHLPCRGLSVAELRSRVDAVRAAGLGALLIIRGDAKEGEDPGGIRHAVEALDVVRREDPGIFLATACHPLGHPDDVSPEAAMRHLQAKADAGADLLMAQFCLDPKSFLAFRRRVRGAGISTPIRPGVLGVERFSQAVRAAERCGVPIEPFAQSLEADVDDLYPRLVRSDLRQYAAAGIPGAHLFTLNRPMWTDPSATSTAYDR